MHFLNQKWRKQKKIWEDINWEKELLQTTANKSQGKKFVLFWKNENKKNLEDKKIIAKSIGKYQKYE